MNTTDIGAIRRDYKLKALTETDAAGNALEMFSRWWQEATASNIDEVNAMTLATCTPEGVPAARTVLLKGFDEKGFVFYTNYESQKGLELEQNPRACLLFFWKELERQVRITGLVQKTAPAASDAYFNSRPEGSRLGAIASPQSRVIANREWLETKLEEVTQATTGLAIERPEHWGGYAVVPVSIEFWQGRPSRLHDRLLYTLQADGTWKMERLAP
jgi:pyridoxamine 5'-phosphate oxidase